MTSWGVERTTFPMGERLLGISFSWRLGFNAKDKVVVVDVISLYKERTSVMPGVCLGWRFG